MGVVLIDHLPLRRKFLEMFKHGIGTVGHPLDLIPLGGIGHRPPIHIKLSASGKPLWHYVVARHTIMPIGGASLMTTIPQVARAMRETLTTTADEAARATRFVQRTSPLGGATFSQTLVFGFLGNPQATLEELAQTAATLGVSITPQALDQRFTAAAAACLEQVLTAAISRVIAAVSPWPFPCWRAFLRSISRIALRSSCPMPWPGCGKVVAAVPRHTPVRPSSCRSGWNSGRAASLASSSKTAVPRIGAPPRQTCPLALCASPIWATGASRPSRRSTSRAVSGCHASRARLPSTTLWATVKTSWSCLPLSPRR